MKKILFLVLVIIFQIGNSQTIYRAKYKGISNYNSFESDSKKQFEDALINNLSIEFYANKEFCYANETSIIEDSGINISESDGEIYIDYKTGIVRNDLTSNTFVTYKQLKFTKHISKLKILGMATIMFISEDRNIIIYTAKKIPWYIQPGIIDTKQFDAGIVKFENLKTKKGFELIEYNKINYTNSIDKIYKSSTVSKNLDSVKEINCPWFN